MKAEIQQRWEDIQNGIIPDGYKKIKDGIIPGNWNELKFESVLSCLMDGTHFSPKSKNGSLESQTGVYTWLCSYKDIQDNDRKQTGNVILLK